MYGHSQWKFDLRVLYKLKAIKRMFNSGLDVYCGFKQTVLQMWTRYFQFMLFSRVVAQMLDFKLMSDLIWGWAYKYSRLFWINVYQSEFEVKANF